MCMYALLLTTHHCLTPQTVYNYFILLIMFPLWLAIVIIFFVWLFIVKTDKHILLLWLCNYYSLNTIVSWLVNRKITELYISPRNTLVAQRVKSLQCGRTRFDPWVGKIPWRRKWQPTALFLSRKSHGRRSLAGYSPWGCKELDTTEETSLHIYHQN